MNAPRRHPLVGSDLILDPSPLARPREKFTLSTCDLQPTGRGICARPWQRRRCTNGLGLIFYVLFCLIHWRRTNPRDSCFLFRRALMIPLISFQMRLMKYCMFLLSARMSLPPADQEALMDASEDSPPTGWL